MPALITGPKLINAEHTSMYGDFIAVNNPVIYQIQRRDYLGTISNSGGFIKFTIDNTTSYLGTGGISVNDLIILGKQNLSSIDYTSCKITSKTTVGSNIELVTDAAFATTGSGFINLKKLNQFYFILSDQSVYDAVEDAFNPGTPSIIISPDSYGRITVNLSELFKSRFPSFSLSIPASQQDDNQISGVSQIYLFFSWQGFSDVDNLNKPYKIDLTTPTTDQYYFLQAKKNVTDLFQSNLALYNETLDYQKAADSAFTNINTGGTYNWTYIGGPDHWSINVLAFEQSNRLNIVDYSQKIDKGRYVFFIDWNTIDLGTDDYFRLELYLGTVLVQTVMIPFDDLGSTFKEHEFEAVAEFNKVNVSIQNGPQSITAFEATSIRFYSRPRWLTKFRQPSLWLGYPMTLNAIIRNLNASFDNGLRVNNGTTDTEVANWDAPGTGVVHYKRISIHPFVTVDKSQVAITYPYTSNPLANYSEQIIIKVKSPCKNPVYLYWKNSLGGDAWWMFEYNQELSTLFSETAKKRRMLLFADNLSRDEFEAIDELNSVGEVYSQIQQTMYGQDNDMKRDGANVRLVKSNGDSFSVIVIPQENTILTKHSEHSISILIELP